MIKKGLVSIVIPVYKVEEYLDRCIQSVLNQDYKEIEILLIDDGSPDNCGVMCDDYEKKDSRIKVVHKENGGVSTARNVGIEIASGEFLTFVDSDDYLERGAIRNLVIKQQERNFDMVFGKTAFIENGGIRLPVFFQEELFDMNISENIFNVFSLEGSHPPYAKLYKTEIIKKNGIRFREGIAFGEDCIFVSDYIEKVESIAIYDCVVYNYEVENQTSASHKFYDKYYEYSKIFTDTIKKISMKITNNPDIKSKYEKFIINRFIFVIYHCLTNDLKIERTTEYVKNSVEIYKDDINFDLLKNEFTEKEVNLLQNGKYREFIYLWKALKGYRFLKKKIKQLLLKMIG